MLKLPRSFGYKLKILLAGFLLLNLAVYSVYLLGQENTLTETFQSSKNKLSYSLLQMLEGYGSGYFKKSKTLSRNRKVLLPASFDIDHDALNHHLHDTSARHWLWEKLDPSEIIETPPIAHGKFFETDEAKLFNSAKEVPRDQCFLGTGERVPIYTDQIEIVPGNIKNILKIYLEELDDYNDEYNEDIAPILADHVRVELEKDIIAPYWFRLSGSSVWLKDYNVHILVSRLIFSHQKNRVRSDASLVLAQIFDKDWKELNDVRLVFPTNKIDSADSPTFESDGQDFYSYRFPRIMPIPFFHEYKKKGMNYIGPEDPRIFLARNPKGYDEPMIVYNADQYRHRTNGQGEKEVKKTRNMFMSSLFQLQKGKNDYKANPKADYKYFTKTKELMAGRDGRTDQEKNWTPIVSENQASFGSDRYVYFATQVSNLKIIKCDLYSDSPCEIDYDAPSSVGILRGGTPFVNINQLLRKQTNFNIRKLIPEGREIWFGMARAHFVDCGCSNQFYRPNMVVLVKDEATYFDKKTNQFVTKNFWKLSHVASFFGMGVDIVPWHPDNPDSICLDINALIPNGIANWHIRDFGHSHGKWYADDVMTLFFSISDYTVDKINIKGLLHMLMNTRDNSLFMNVPTVAPNKHLNQPVLTEDGKLEKEVPGFSNSNIDCAMEESRKFCKKYAEEQKTRPNVFDPLEVSQAMEQMEDMLHVMDEPLKKVGF